MEHLISQTNPAIVSVYLGAALAVAWMAGAWLARLDRHGPEAPHSKFGDAGMALLALLLAFTFGTSIAKNDQRRLLVVQDANAISGFYTCASFLNDPLKDKLHDLIRRYTQLWIGASATADLAGTINELDQLQQQMTDLVGQAIHSGTPLAVPLINGLNGLVGSDRSQIAAVQDRLPMTVVLLLLFAAFAATLLVGREHHRGAARDLVGTAFFIAMLCLVVYVSADLNRPMTGLSRVSQAPMEHLLAAMGPSTGR
jgi:hypothetical protein